MKRLAFAIAFALACARHTSGPIEPAGDEAFLDRTGADVAQWDSLSRTYARGPELLDPIMIMIPFGPALEKTHVTTVFTIDERGRVTRISMTPAPEDQYATALVAEYRKLRFRPATRSGGKPTKGYYKFEYSF